MSKWYKIEPLPEPKSLEDFAKFRGLELLIRQTHVNRWTAGFKGVEIKDGSILEAAYGVGETAKQAVSNYIAKIVGKDLVVNAMDRKKRREFTAWQTMTFPFIDEFFPQR